MKKILILLSSLILFIYPLIGCNEKNNGLTKVRVNEVTHSIFYAPFYVAIENNFFKDEGIEIELTNGGGANVCMTSLLSKGCDVALMGPEASIYVLIEGKEDLPKIFAQLTKRDGSFLVSRKNEPNFKWSDLKNKYIIAGRKGGVPAMTFQYVVEKHNLINGTNITLDNDVQFPVMGPTFESGLGDYVTLFEPTASEYQNAGKGYVVASVGSESGEVPYTAFTSLTSYVNNNKEIIEKFTRAMHKAIKYVNDEKTDKVAESIKNQFASTSIASIKMALESYKSIDAWMTKMSMTEDSFNRLQDIIENAGELSKRVKFEKLIDNTYSDKTYNEVFK